MNRRNLLKFGVLASAGAAIARSFTATPALAEGAAKKKITDKDVLKDGQAATIANYCSNPDKQPNKFCPAWKEKPGHCEKCNFFNTDNSLADYKGGKVAHCSLLTDASKPQYVSTGGWCSTFLEKQG